MALSKYGVQDRQLTPTERWVCFAALFFFGFTAACNLFKAPPVLTVIASDLGLASSMIGMVMTTYSIAALVLAWPGMWIMQRLGVKFSVVCSGVIMLLGSVIVVFSSSVAAFMVGRTIEGCAYGLICVIGPNIMPRLFPLKNQGLCMGIWSQWIPVGTIIAGVAAPAIFAGTGSWRAIWWFTIAMEVIALVWMIISVKMPAVNENEINDGDVTKPKKPQKSFMFAGIMVSVAFTFWVYAYVCNINGLYPTFLQEVKGLGVAASAWPTNVIALITIPVGIAVGVLADKVACRRILLGTPYLIVAIIIFFLAFTENDSMTGPWIFSVIMGLCASCIPTCTRAIIQVLVPEPKKTDVALTTMAFVTGVAQVCATFASMSVAALGWAGNAHYVVAPCALIAAIICFVFVKSDKVVGELRIKEQADD